MHALVQRRGPDGEIAHDAAAKVLYINGRSDAKTYVDITRDDMGNSDAWDDQLVITMTFYAEGPDETETFAMPYFETSGGGEIGDTTANRAQAHVGRLHLLRRIARVQECLTNGTSMPMRADGWFTVLTGGEDGFNGGSGPECVHASNTPIGCSRAGDPTLRAAGMATT